MMAMLILLMVSLSLLVQVELQMGLQQKGGGEAKQNALLALNIALSDLQKHAGPDQRVTGRADLLDENATHRHWTGVWHSNPNPGGATPFERGEPHWLISTPSAAPNPSNEALVNPVMLVGAGSSETEFVSADLIPITQDGVTLGNFAYWVGDEGIKVNTLAREPDGYKATPANAYADQLLRLNMAHQPQWQTLFGDGFELDPHLQDRMFSLDQLDLLEPGLPVSRHFHDLSPYSKGLLTNVADGGLKKDLTRILAPGFTGDYPDSRLLVSGSGFPDPPSWGLLRSFYNSGNDTELGTSWGDLTSPVRVRPHSFDNHTHGVSPILGMLQMNWGVRAEPGTRRLQITIIPVVTLLNPHNVTLAPTNYRIRIYWREGKLEDSDEDGSEKHSGALLVAWKAPIGKDLYYDVAPYIRQDVHGDDGIELEIRNAGFAPGEARIFSISGQHHYTPGSSSPLPMTPGWNPIFNFASLDFTPETILAASELGLQFEFLMRWSSVEAILSAEVTVDGSTQFRPVQEVKNALYISSQMAKRSINHAFHIGTAAAPSRIHMRHSNHDILQFSGANMDRDSGARWMAIYNPRAPVSQANSRSARTGQPLYDGYDRAMNMNDVQFDPGTNRAFWGGDNKPGDGQHFVPLYDIPRQVPVSLGSLQHANLSSQSWQPSYPFANSWASPYYEYNEEDISYALNQELWDDYFFSGLDAGLTSWPAPGDWRNTRLRPLEQATVSEALVWDRAAGNLAVQGSFNINSTSVPAWESLLKSLQGLSVPYNDPTLNGGLRSYDSGDDTPFPRGSLSSGAGNTPWRGFRALTDDEINQLAQDIVAEIRKRGPFRSLADFVNRDLAAPRGSDENLKGALQAAIDNTTINEIWEDPEVPQTTNPPVNQYPEANLGPRSTAAPGYLTQADLLQVLGPVISARSDTFRIRAYGNSINPVTGRVTGQAWCEAIVQRLPDYLNAADTSNIYPPTQAVNQQLGRKFVVVGFRWLEADEI